MARSSLFGSGSTRMPSVMAWVSNPIPDILLVVYRWTVRASHPLRDSLLMCTSAPPVRQIRTTLMVCHLSQEAMVRVQMRMMTCIKRKALHGCPTRRTLHAAIQGFCLQVWYRRVTLPHKHKNLCANTRSLNHDAAERLCPIVGTAPPPLPYPPPPSPPPPSTRRLPAPPPPPPPLPAAAAAVAATVTTPVPATFPSPPPHRLLPARGPTTRLHK